MKIEGMSERKKLRKLNSNFMFLPLALSRENLYQLVDEYFPEDSTNPTRKTHTRVREIEQFLVWINKVPAEI